MKPQYYKYSDSQYIVLSDGTVARILKETNIGRQTYYNLIIDGKLKRVNVKSLMKPFDEVTKEDVES
jgi:hypothetical protein